jgi:hypothetical protein
MKTATSCEPRRGVQRTPHPHPHRPWALLAFAASLVLGACGGGGGDASPDENNPLWGTARLSLANQETAARAAMLVLTGTVSNGAGGGLAAGRSTPLAAAAGNTVSGGPLLMALPARLLSAIGASVAVEAPAHRARALGTLGPFVSDCAFGGTRSITLDDRDDSGLPSPGDVIDAVDAGCRDVADAETNGRVRLTLTAVQTAPTLAIAADGAFFGYVWNSTTSVRRVTVGGPFGLTLAEPDANRTDSRFVAGNDFVVGITHPRGSDTVTLLPGYVVELWEQLSNPRYGGLGSVQVACGGVIDSRALGGTLLVFGEVPNFEQVGDERHPRVGVGNATTAAGGKLRLTALSTARVRIDGDFDGDGAVYESVTDVDWADLV